jgi:hypothetical protein
MNNQIREGCFCKYAEYIANGRFSGGVSLERRLEKSTDFPVSSFLRHALAFTFGIKSAESVWMRRTPCTYNFELYFIGVDNEVIEICSRRTLRQFGKKWYRRWCESHPYASTTERERMENIFKFKWQVKIQGGLMRQLGTKRKQKDHDVLLSKPWERIENPRMP